MPSRDVMDGRVDVYKDQGKDTQNNGRGNGDWGLNYGQTLLDNGRPSDQPNDGPQLPATLRSDAWWDVFQAPEPTGYGCILGARAEEGATTYVKGWNAEIVADVIVDLIPGEWEEVEVV